MTIAITSKTTLYDRDFYEWVQETTEKLKMKDFDHVDLENLIEEVESLGTSERSENYAYQDALDEVLSEKGYKSVKFPDTWQFSRDIDSMLNVDFCE